MYSGDDENDDAVDADGGVTTTTVVLTRRVAARCYQFVWHHSSVLKKNQRSTFILLSTLDLSVKLLILLESIFQRLGAYPINSGITYMIYCLKDFWHQN